MGEIAASCGVSLGVGVAFAAGEVDLDKGPLGAHGAGCLVCNKEQFVHACQHGVQESSRQSLWVSRQGCGGNWCGDGLRSQQLRGGWVN